jgi:hypothetical protein
MPQLQSQLMDTAKKFSFYNNDTSLLKEESLKPELNQTKRAYDDSVDKLIFQRGSFSFSEVAK